MKYKLTLVAIVCACFHLSQGQTIKNANFETGNSTPWQFSNPATYNSNVEPGYTFSITKEPTKQNNFAAFFKSTANSQWCQIRQRIAYKPTDSIEKLRITANIKIEAAENSSAGIAARALQGEKNLGLFMGSITGTKEWTPVSCEFIVGKKTDSLSIFCTMRGEGQVWFDDIKIEKITADKIEQSKEARVYLDTALHIISKNALYKDSVDFEDLIQHARIIAADAKSTAECYGAIKYVIEGLEDHHSFFQTPEEANFLNRKSDKEMLLPSGKLIASNIGYVRVPPCMAISKEMERLYADSMQRIIKDLDSKKIQGWIVDNRDNTGGNCWPMLLGLGPILGEGVFERKLASGVITDSVGYWRGIIRDKDSVIIETPTPYQLLNPFPKVALLMNRKSASSGEGVILSFKNRPKARLFGEASYGVSTGNSDFTLSDGAMIFVCSGKQTDRLGNEYGGKIYPDVSIEDIKTTSTDEVIMAAQKWLLGK